MPRINTNTMQIWMCAVRSIWIRKYIHNLNIESDVNVVLTLDNHCVSKHQSPFEEILSHKNIHLNYYIRILSQSSSLFVLVLGNLQMYIHFILFFNKFWFCLFSLVQFFEQICSSEFRCLHDTVTLITNYYVTTFIHLVKFTHTFVPFRSMQRMIIS